MTDLFVKSTDAHQFLDPNSSHRYHGKKRIPYSQALKLSRICSDSESFDRRCYALEGWLMKRGYNGKMIRKQISRAREHSRKDFRKREKQKPPSRNLRLILPTTQFFKTLETDCKNSICY